MGENCSFNTFVWKNCFLFYSNNFGRTMFLFKMFLVDKNLCSIVYLSKNCLFEVFSSLKNVLVEKCFGNFFLSKEYFSTKKFFAENFFVEKIFSAQKMFWSYILLVRKKIFFARKSFSMKIVDKKILVICFGRKIF